MKLPITHKSCGATVMWWVADRLPIQYDRIRSSDVMLMDGSHPEMLSKMPRCPSCGHNIQGFNDLERHTINDVGEIVPFV